MKKPTIFLLMFFAFITILSAQNRGIFTSVQNGVWTDPATWGGTTTPSVGDEVTISDTVQLDTSITGNGLAKLTVTSTGSLIQDTDQTDGLIMAQRSALTVDGYMEVNKLEIKHGFFGSETITVNGTLIIHGDFKRGGSFINPTPVTGDGTVSAETYTNPGFGSNDTIFGVPQSDLEDGQSYGGATWKGGSGWSGKEKWSKGSNWYSGSVPTSSQDVVIMDRSYEPIISSSGMKYANSLLIQHGASLTINSSANLTITDTTLNGIIIQSDSTESGSLIYYSNINGVNNPKATAQRYVKKDRWNMVSPSTTDVTGQTFYGTTDSDSWLTYFVESEGADGGSAGDGWHFITNVNVSDSVGKGYTYWPTIDETVEFKGELRSTDISPNIAYSGSGYGYNLLGNPFSSSLLWDGSTAWGLSNMESTIWIWDGSQYQALPSGSASYTIAIGQGFFVRATGTNPTLTIPSSKRTVSGSTFLKSSNVQDKDFNHLVITVQNNQYKDEVFIYFDESGTEDFDNGYDATKMFGLAEAPQIYLVENDMKLTYDFLPEVSEGEERTVALNYIPGAAGEQMLTIDYSDLSGVEVTLEDLLTGITQNLNSKSVYSFTGLKEDDPNRFLLHFAWSPNGIEEEMEKVSSDIQIYSYNKDVYIRSVNQAVNQTGNVFVYDMMGRELLQKKIDGSELVKLPVNIANNYVIVKVVKSGSIKTQKVFIK
jgi:hypothetical protein